ncbi:amidohydrolase [Arthrobacter mobilis]|uniref:Amidohydrolase n=1 Tax=Arthrobacter mobilis TaxID=2724944 RepID=A0A7X6H9M2_9MICC|nr:amidohydrolase [Arthrobacter mobilis]NKX53014.1 amidohydrolase [Arthrobacter mobilis]
MTLTIFHSGTIAADPATGQEGPTALAVADGEIVAVGEAALTLLAEADETVDLDGGYLSPSFADGHAHPLFGGLEDLGPQIRSCHSVEQIVESVRAWAQENPDAEWIIGASYDATLAPDGLFDAAWLDAAVPERPVLLRSWDYHTIWVNSAALAAAGIDAETPEPALGRIVRRADGSPLGTLMEPGAIDLVLAVTPGFSLEQRVSALQTATAKYAAAGLTWIQDAWVEPDNVEAYLTAAAQGRLNARINLAFRADPVTWRDQPEAFEAARRQVAELDSPLLTAGTVKFFLDGIIESRTACMLSPYTDAPDDSGLPNWATDELHDAMATFDRLGFQLHLHAIGDAAVRMALDGLEEVQRRNGARDRRPVIAHLQVIDPADIPRFAELGVVANFEPLWACADDVMRLLTIPRLGEKRAELQYPIASLTRAGVQVSFGSDWPVTGHHPVPGLATAVTRQTPDHAPDGGWLPNERIDVETALAAYTSGVAWQAFAEDRWGALRPGMSADLVWLAQDPRTVPAGELSAVEIRGTWLAGRPTWQHSSSPISSPRPLAAR